MSRTIPIIRLRDTFIVSIQIELSDALVLELKDNIAQELRQEDIRGLIIEVSGVDIFDSYVACAVRDIAQIARLMGVHTLLVGLDPGMAITLVEMGMDMRGLETALNLESALDSLERRAKAEQHLRGAIEGIVGGEGEGDTRDDLESFVLERQ